MRPSGSKRQQAPQPPSTRMGLRSFRNVPLVPMETSSSSSSDDSCDSFGSDGAFANTKSSFREAKKVAERAKVFEASSEEVSLSGFENAFSSEMSAMRVDSDSEESVTPRKRGRRSQTLKVAMTFPTRRASQKKSIAAEPPKQPKIAPKQTTGEGDNFMDKRALNIRENKAMLAKLMAELDKIPGFPRRTALPMMNAPCRTPRRSQGAPGPRRRIPERTSRPHTRSRSLVDGPPSEEEEEEEDKFSLVRRSCYYEKAPRRRSYNGVQAFPHVVRPVKDISQRELDLIADNVREKVYNSSTGSTCHQCRQKTVDTKTNCRNPECVGVRGQFCGPCLRNRYGEEVRDALLDPEWECPSCRGICNCSFCRAREGRCATGVLVYLAKYHGYDNVHSYLKSLKKEMEEGQ
ncbi:cell division cycle-associated protein 7-like [Oncorhynchus nerka]|uniref:cell division cycle-associated protein 7-like n=1 Tax=Oncorhynchus nerka TaxID=8023 RepID=UPI0011312EC5|nr:cell division cycle-associated protein 7-like [Oncorhynchus nerka]